jgi:uncharacterized protein (DUF2141 family)
MKFTRLILALTVAALSALTARANIAATDLRIQGASLRVVNGEVTVNVDMPSTVQT